MEPGSTQMQKVTPKQLINARIWGQGEVGCREGGWEVSYEAQRNQGKELWHP